MQQLYHAPRGVCDVDQTYLTRVRPNFANYTKFPVIMNYEAEVHDPNIHEMVGLNVQSVIFFYVIYIYGIQPELST